VNRQPKPDALYDPVLKRYRATCELCGFVAVRAQRESAIWNLQQHYAYNHEHELERGAAARGTR
jgi:hypothetical protein